MSVDEGLVFLSDTRTNAGVDHISTARKMSVFEQPGERMLVLLGAGNLSLTQAVLHELSEPSDPSQPTLWSAPTMADAARVIAARCVACISGRRKRCRNSASTSIAALFSAGRLPTTGRDCS